MTAAVSARVTDYIDRFNQAVVSGDWVTFAAALTADAELVFPDIPIGPFRGRPAIVAAYRDRPPDDTVIVREVDTDGPVDTVRVRWQRGGGLVLRLTWRAEQVEQAEVTFV
jgi:steroid Delta-isomerase